MPDRDPTLSRPTALLVDKSPQDLAQFSRLVEDGDFETTAVHNLEAARRHLREETPDVVFCERDLPDGTGIDLLRDLEGAAGPEVVLLTSRPEVDSAVTALRLGALDYLSKPVDRSRLEALLKQIRRTRELRQEVSALRRELRELGRFGPLIGASAPMQEVYDLIEKVAATGATVFLMGESGTGKELAAETVHRLSRRRDEAFLPLNCGAISPNLLESELFGHEKGAFTGANRRHQGYFERADQGTLFLDEITEMPVELQVKLLRSLESGVIRRVGGDKPIPVDVRVIAATNRNPEEALEEGKLREDLFYRLNVFPIRLPVLAERSGDVELLAKTFLERLNQEHEEEKRWSEDALECLSAYGWPGNVRELQNVVTRAFILAEGFIEVEHLPESVRGGESYHRATFRVHVGSSIAEVEKRLIQATLEELDGNKRRTAETLGISVKTLYNRLKSYETEEAEEPATQDAAAC
ncbi:MAG: sigma-54 dependent transcriptional regulator [Thermoanaerobaculia bacterium]|nr:sigma-54 dependent transcriptional regulator [Thermoanaerobaculia bacterium]